MGSEREIRIDFGWEERNSTHNPEITKPYILGHLWVNETTTGHIARIYKADYEQSPHIGIWTIRVDGMPPRTTVGNEEQAKSVAEYMVIEKWSRFSQR